MPKDLQTLKLARTSRTYFFDIAKSSKGLYLRMSCSEKNRTGFENHRLFVFEEDISSFLAVLQKSTAELEKLKTAGKGRSRKSKDVPARD